LFFSELQFTYRNSIQVSTKEIFTDCILCFQADEDVYEISHFDRNDKADVRERGRRDRALRARSRLPHQHRDDCHFDPPTGGEKSKKCDNNFTLGLEF